MVNVPPTALVDVLALVAVMVDKTMSPCFTGSLALGVVGLRGPLRFVSSRLA
ncbi:hypothetical protein D3C78_1601270 [compost metagenome]